MAEKPTKAAKASQRPRMSDAQQQASDENVTRAVKSLDKSNLGVIKALEYVGEGLAAIQSSRRRDRMTNLALAFVVLLILFGLAVNAYEGRVARQKLIDNDAKQEQTLQIVKDATSPEAQRRAQEELGRAFVAIDCNNQRAIQRAMDLLGHNYPLTEDCR